MSAAFSAMPPTLSDASAEWLIWALSRKHPQANVLSARPVGLTHGAATKIAFDVTYGNPDSGLPTRVWIKGGWEAHSAMMIEIGCYAREAWFYEHLAPWIDLRAPRGLYAASEASGNGVVVLEDLLERGARLWTCAIPATIEEVGRGVEALARLHAMAVPSTNRIALSSPVTAEAAAQWTTCFDAAYLASELDGPRGDGVPDYAKKPERVIAAYRAMVEELAQRPEVLLHGDCHPGNVFSDNDGQVGFYDWQTLAMGPWAHDIAYLIVASCSIDDRRRAERDLLCRYLDAFAESGGTPPDWNDAWRDYRKYIAYAFYIWMSVPEVYQPLTASKPLTARLSQAAEDFDFFSLWP